MWRVTLCAIERIGRLSVIGLVWGALLIHSPRSLAQETSKPKDSSAGGAERDQKDSSPRYFATGIVYDKQTQEPIAVARVNFLVEDERDPDKRSPVAVSDNEGRYRLEVPLGFFRLWSPRLKPGYWIESEDAIAPLVTSPAEPVVTHDIPARRGLAWPVRIVLTGDKPPGCEIMIAAYEIDDDSVRAKWINRQPVSSSKRPTLAVVTIGPDGVGALTQCGDSGKLVVSISGENVDGLTTEMIVEPGFDMDNVASLEPVADSDKTILIDAASRRATVSKARVVLDNRRPTLVFELAPRAPTRVQSFVGRIVDADGKPLEGVRVGCATSTANGAGGVGREVARTDADGQFNLIRGWFQSADVHYLQLVLTKDGYAAFDSPRIELPKQAGEPIEVGQITMQPGHSIAVLVVDDEGAPAAGAVVEAQGDYAQRSQAVRTNAEGRAVLRNLPAGVLPVSAMYGSQFYRSRLVVDEQGEETTLHLRAMPQTTGQHVPAVKSFPDPPPLGTDAPELSLVGWTDGRERSLADYRGKIVVLEFWGVWCSACLNSLPSSKQIEAKYADRDVVFLAIHSAGTDMSQVKKLQALKEWNVPTGLDRGDDIVEGATARAYGAHGWPTTVIIDRQGKIAFNSNLEKWTAFTAWKEQLRIAKALNLPPEKPGATIEDRIARNNTMRVFQMSEVIDRTLAGQ